MLSTPPAFILSQDQTLVKSVCPVQNNSGHLLNLWIVFCNPFYCFLEIFIFWRCSLKIYKKFSGMVYDSVFNVLFSCRQSLIDDLRTIRCFFFLLLSATFISYHRFKCLSTTFLFIFFRKYCRKCFAFMTCTSSDASFYVVCFLSEKLFSQATACI